MKTTKTTIVDIVANHLLKQVIWRYTSKQSMKATKRANVNHVENHFLMQELWRKTFTQIHEVRIWKSYPQAAEDIWKCKSCVQSFSYSHHLKKHIQTITEGQKDHKCELRILWKIIFWSRNFEETLSHSSWSPLGKIHCYQTFDSLIISQLFQNLLSSCWKQCFNFVRHTFEQDFFSQIWPNTLPNLLPLEFWGSVNRILILMESKGKEVLKTRKNNQDVVGVML